MSGKKRKRSIKEDPVDISKMKTAMTYLISLKEGLENVQEAEKEMEKLMTHVRALERILEDAKKPRMSFSTVSAKEIINLGIVRSRLVFRLEGVKALLSSSNELGTANELSSLVSRLKEIFDHVNMDYESGARMLLDAVLLSVAKIATKRQTDQRVAILPEMRVTITGDGVLVKNPTSDYELWLTGSIDYGVIQYQDDPESKAILLGEDASRLHVFDVAAGWLFLVEAKRLSGASGSLSLHMPEAIAQALALGEYTHEDTVRFCLSNGRSWIFAILVKRGNGEYVVYESTPRYLDRGVQYQTENAKESVQTIVELLLFWLSPTDETSKALYELKD